MLDRLLNTPLRKDLLTLSAPISQNSQTHSNNSSAFANELFECV